MNIALRTFIFNCLCAYFLLAGSVYADEIIVKHQLQVILDPAQHSLQASDRIQLQHPGYIDFYLHAGLNPRVEGENTLLVRTGELPHSVPLESWRLTLPVDHTDVTLYYGGKIDHDFRSRTEAPGRDQQLLSGTISNRGVFLDAATAWYPLLSNSRQQFELSVTLPENWLAISQGKGPSQNPQAPLSYSWVETHPQQEIYLIAGQYHSYSRNTPGSVSAQVYLQQADEKLAQRYLDTTEYYIKLYEKLIGDYPYPKFALIENFWETGYGMPSFTLLGPRVIRLPFILHSSYPHEILHNWWGNGVYVDYQSGNWSEGLTSYLADHLIKEQSGQGVAYRHDALQRYISFVRSENDFPLRDFRSRHSGSSQAVGYGKGLMLFHMLRRKLGDDVFIQGLRKFYQDNAFQTAGFDHIKRSFEEVSEYALDGFFAQWLDRTGAPTIEVESLTVERRLDGYRLVGEIQQTQNGPAYVLEVPLIVYMGKQQPPRKESLSMDDKHLSFSLDLPAKPLRAEFDPWFDLFRTLDIKESPPVLANLFGSKSVTFILPEKAQHEEKEAYLEMAQQWAQGYEQASIRYDDEVESLESGQMVWLLGQNNRFKEQFLGQLSAEQLSRNQHHWLLKGEKIDPAQHSLILSERGNNNQLIAWVAAANPESITGLTRKLPHYGKYSYLAFEGKQPTIRNKGQWAVADSPMVFSFSGSTPVTNRIHPPALVPTVDQ